MSEILAEIDELGFASVPQFADGEQIEKLIACSAELKNFLPVEKSETIYGVRNLLNLAPETRKFVESPPVVSLVEKVLGEKAKPVRAIFFDKTPDTNWKVPWHQDLTIAVREKRETEGFTAWTRKADVPHVQPPVSILERMLAMRIHLDDADETNGALKVIPKSHRCGRLSAAEIQEWRRKEAVKICRAKCGEAFLMRPLLVHSSSAGTSPKHRRVIHIEFSADDLPNDLQWYGS